MTDTAWKYRVVISNCKVENSSSSECPVSIQTRGGTFPSPGMRSSYSTHCPDSSTQCVLEVLSPQLDIWHYMAITVIKSVNVSFQLTVNKYGKRNKLIHKFAYKLKFDLLSMSLPIFTFIVILLTGYLFCK